MIEYNYIIIMSFTVVSCESQFFSVKAGLLKHRVVCFGYSLQETDLPGKYTAIKPTALYIYMYM